MDFQKAPRSSRGNVTSPSSAWRRWHIGAAELARDLFVSLFLGHDLISFAFGAGSLEMEDRGDYG
jgi:hypothetical protein